MTKTGANDTLVSASTIHSRMLRHSTDDVFKKYQIEHVLGQGSMGSVCKVRIRPDKIGGSAYHPKHRGIMGLFKVREHHPSPHQTYKANGSGGHSKDKHRKDEEHVYALKTILLDRVTNTFVEELKNEIAILRTLDHPNIVRLYEQYITKITQRIYIVLELCDGGDMYTRSPYSEKEAAKYVNQLTSAVAYMHEHNVVHRDIKYENILFENKSQHAGIKVIDFGLSKKFWAGPVLDMYDRVGTIYTMAPQVLQGVYSSQADLWSTGVMAFMLLSSSKPFWSKRRRTTIDLIMRADYNFLAPVWKNISDDAKDFVSKLLVLDPKKRMNADQALKHPWLVHRESLANDYPSTEILKNIDECLLLYTQTSELKKLALNVIAHRSTTKDILKLRRAFEKFDAHSNGIITFSKFEEALRNCHYSDEVLHEIFSSVDVNHNGHIDYTEFLAATIEAHGQITEDHIAEAFDRLNSDATGYISKENLREILGDDIDQIDRIFKACDQDKDGKISYKEFLVAFRVQTRDVARRVSRVVQTEHSTDGKLVGLDAKIPGGRIQEKSLDQNKV